MLFPKASGKYIPAQPRFQELGTRLQPPDGKSDILSPCTQGSLVSPPETPGYIFFIVFLTFIYLKFQAQHILVR